MTARETLHRLVDDLTDPDLPTATRLLRALSQTSDPVERRLASAPFDEEPDDDDFDGGLTEARQEDVEGRHLSHDEVKRELGLS